MPGAAGEELERGVAGGQEALRGRGVREQVVRVVGSIDAELKVKEIRDALSLTPGSGLYTVGLITQGMRENIDYIFYDK